MCDHFRILCIRKSARIGRFLASLSTFCVALLSAGAVQARAQTPTFTNLHNFSARSNTGSNADGASPQASLIQASDGNFYGTCVQGGAHNSGTIFQITPAGAFTTLYSFSALSYDSTKNIYFNTDGAGPDDLMQASDGNFYGAAGGGGVNGSGTIFKITPSGAFTTLYNFATNSSGINSDGSGPVGLIQANDGNLYGTTSDGGANGEGTIFKVTLSGTLSTLHSFNKPTDGAYPQSGLIQARDGNFYGTCAEGGPNGSIGTGTIYKITTSGTFTVLYDFSALNDTSPSYPTNSDGARPFAGLIQANDGNLYGACPMGGANGTGTLFRITPAGTFTVLHTFNALSSTGTNMDGYAPSAGLMQASDGNLYGTAYLGGANGEGTIFQITPAGAFTTLYSFSALSNGKNTDGAEPWAALIQASDGNLYGNATFGGVNGTGTIYSLDAVQSVSVPSDFNGDGKPDLLFQNASTGQLAVWFMNGITPSGGAFVTPSQSSAWKAVGDADFTGDGKPDILFENTSTNQLALWTMNGVTAANGQLLSPTPPSGWNVVSIADFNGDGHPDLLLQNSSTGRLAIWTMNGATITDGTYVTPTPSSGWIVVGSGDFNGDGKPDILLQNPSTGQLAVWYMNNNATATGGAYITPSQQTGWKCVSVIDFNGDGHPDLVFQNTSTGKLVYWLLNGVQAVDGNTFSTQPQSGWQVVGPH